MDKNTTFVIIHRKWGGGGGGGGKLLNSEITESDLDYPVLQKTYAYFYHFSSMF